MFGSTVSTHEHLGVVRDELPPSWPLVAPQPVYGRHSRKWYRTARTDRTHSTVEFLASPDTWASTQTLIM